MYDMKTIEILDGFCIVVLIPLSAISLFFTVVALAAIIRLKQEGYTYYSIFGNLVLADVLFIICQVHALMMLLNNRQLTVYSDVMCNMSGVVFNTVLTVTWWTLALAFLQKSWSRMLHPPSRSFVALTLVWTGAVVLSLIPYLAKEGYRLSWTHGFCLGDETSILSFVKGSRSYEAIGSALLIVKYAIPVVFCIGSIVKYIYSNQIVAGWSGTVVVFLVTFLLHLLWIADNISRYYRPVVFPIPTGTIVLRTLALLVLFFKPILSILCMVKFFSEFKSSMLHVIRLEYRPKNNQNGNHYEQMYSVAGDDVESQSHDSF